MLETLFHPIKVKRKFCRCSWNELMHYQNSSIHSLNVNQSIMTVKSSTNIITKKGLYYTLMALWCVSLHLMRRSLKILFQNKWIKYAWKLIFEFTDTIMFIQKSELKWKPMRLNCIFSSFRLFFLSCWISSYVISNQMV